MHFVRQAMRLSYHCEPYALPEVVFVAVQHGNLVGCMAVSLSDDGRPFPMEDVYLLQEYSFPTLFDRSKIVQLGRWVAAVPSVSHLLLWACVRYAIEQGCMWGIGEVKPKVIRRFHQMGIRVVRLSCTPMLEKVAPDVLPYYLLPPPPVPCAFFLRDVMGVLREGVAQRIEEKKVVINDI
jgi:hypothetical protein